MCGYVTKSVCACVRVCVHGNAVADCGCWRLFVVVCGCVSSCVCVD